MVELGDGSLKDGQLAVLLHPQVGRGGLGAGPDRGVQRADVADGGEQQREGVLGDGRAGVAGVLQTTMPRARQWSRST